MRHLHISQRKKIKLCSKRLLQSFIAIATANKIQFGNIGTFSASVPNNPALLTVNPTALFYNQIAASNPTFRGNNSEARKLRIETRMAIAIQLAYILNHFCLGVYEVFGSVFPPCLRRMSTKICYTNTFSFPNHQILAAC
ncbi:MAG: hypothetical protein PUP91_00835 [Rhizonema sp. PD37]|nr:hypothetical protein [Rhizonema sp. PD37]